MADATRLLIKNGTLIDGSGGEPVPNKLLVVEGNRITLVSQAEGSDASGNPQPTGSSMPLASSYYLASSTRIATSRFTRVRCRA